MIYLDNAATTQLDPAVLETMMPYLTGQYGNPGGIYKLGRDARAAVEKAREQVARLINAEPEQIIFTSGGTEGNNMVFEMCANYMVQNGRTELLVSAIEHDSVLKCAEKVCHKYSFAPIVLYPNKLGRVGITEVKGQLARAGSPGLVSVMAMNNEIASMNPIKDIATVCHEHGALFHTDCVQATGQMVIDVKSIDCDFATISSHKIHGPKGVGAVYIKDKSQFEPLLIGGANQEFGMRGGTENVAGIVGFGKACELVDVQDASNIRDLKNEFWQVLHDELEFLGLDGRLRLNGAFGFGKVINLGITGVDAETLLLLLDTNGVCVSAGSACNSRESIPSHVLKAIGRSDDEARSSIRVSFSRMNTLDEVRDAARIMAECVATLCDTTNNGEEES